MKLLLEKGFKKEFKEFNEIRKNFNLEKIFKYAFSYLPKVIKTEDDLKFLIDTVFGNFHQDNVVYLEIRSSPKKMENSSYLRYFEILIEKMIEWKDRMEVKFVVSVNRSYKPDIYFDILKIIQSIENFKDFIVGIDFSGDVRKNKFNQYIKVFQ